MKNCFVAVVAFAAATAALASPNNGQQQQVSLCFLEKNRISFIRARIAIFIRAQTRR